MSTSDWLFSSSDLIRFQNPSDPIFGPDAIIPDLKLLGLKRRPRFLLGSPGPEGTSIDDFECFSIKNHGGERVTTMFSKTNPETSPLFTIRREMLIMGSIENRLIEGVQEDEPDIRGYSTKNLKRNLATK